MADKKKVLITGAGGFIGSHLVELCVSRGMKVKAFVRYNSRNHWGWLEQSPCLKDIEVVAGDIRDYDSVFYAMKGCASVFHLAALIGIPYSYVSPQAYIKTNVDGTYNILQAAKELALKNVVVTSTSETYGTAQYVPIDEKHPAVGQSPYSASKIAADQLAISYYRSFGLPVRIVRPFNTYGPRQSARAVIPTIISQVLSGARELKLGNTAPTRDFTFVKDTALGFVEVSLAKSLVGEAVNLGTGTEISVNDLALKIAGLLGKKVKIASEAQRLRGVKTEVERLCSDHTKVTAHTGWVPRYDLDKGLKESILWMQKNLQCYKADLYNV
ncbi:MAG: SDR family NAD(P)-dependent oxidoreductase [Candidatus Omnitrophica bacterium]|nr:SDR family NAD(P)-dependent oxidoreductase [Candidatus Omnitrophota bacterium]